MATARKCTSGKKYFAIIKNPANIYYVTNVNGTLAQFDCLDEMKCEVERFITSNYVAYGKGVCYIINQETGQVAAKIGQPQPVTLPWEDSEPKQK